MTPFPESETMTIKRLEVALRKEDWQLLKDGAYKLHEKFHSGHKFEYLDDLRQVLYTVESNVSKIPPDITDIIAATIKEIIVKFSNDSLPQIAQETYETFNQVQHQSFEQIQQPQTPLEQIAFQTESSLAPQPQNNHEQELNLLYPQDNAGYSDNSTTFEAAQQMLQASQSEVHNFSQIQNQPQQSYSSPTIQNPQPAFSSGARLKDDVVLYYDDAENKIDFTEIKEYRNHLNYLFSKNPQTTDFPLLRQIAWIAQNVNLPISGMDEVLPVMSNIEGKVSLLTTSQSSHIVKTLEMNGIDFMVPFVKRAKKEENYYDLIPMLGLSNLFVCSSCNNRFLTPVEALSLQCPHCGSSAFPDLYAINSYNPDCNPIFWHRAFARLAKARVWILINPPLDQDKEIVFDLMKTAYEAAMPERIYIHSSDSDKREFYKRAFININPNCDIKAHYASQTQLCDEFMNIEVAQRILM